MAAARGKTAASASQPHVTRVMYETDRIYANVNDDVVIHDERGGRRIAIVREGLQDVVLWNPDMDTVRLKKDSLPLSYIIRVYTLCALMG